MKRLLKIIAWIFASLMLLLIALIIYVRSVASVTDPVLLTSDATDALAKVEEVSPGFRKLGSNWFRKSESGLYELYIEGAPLARGLAIGKLTEELIQYQEEVFNAQIHQLVPSDAYLNVLKYFVGWFNRDLDDNVADEFRQEIYGVSRVASHEFDNIAPPYQRILNYHAAHDIGHALQNMSLVGCTAFATWGDRSEDSTLIIGRNFDFYVGDDFAKNKIVAFYSPDKGHRFMMITFGGMTGVLSGMNEAGLTVTLNAAKSEIPTASATPVSILAREILQYASTIDEAYAIAKSRKTFVAEAFMIGSAKDNRTAIIEKSPEAIDLYESGENSIIGTNHYQSKTLGSTELNREHIQKSASEYRFRRVKELLDRDGKNSVQKTAAILRNQKGLTDQSIGLGNEKAVNQLIAHHGIIFQPSEKRVWISATTWQLDEFICYDLDSVFATKMERDKEIHESELTIPADSFRLTKEFQDAIKFNKVRFPFQPRDKFNPDSLIRWNPDSYLSYMLAGDHYLERKDYAKAKGLYETGLAKEVATEQERDHMKENLQTCENHLK
jgi:isopenicillin-N N-acyltransferase like protein